MDRKKVVLKIMVAVMIVAMIVAVTPTQAADYTYNRQAAVEYAKSHWNTNVPGTQYFEKPGHGGDCTNFISWCLHKGGGWPMSGPWHGEEYEWYYYGTPKLYSNSWTCVKEFGNFIGYRGGYQVYYGRDFSKIMWLVNKGDIKEGDVIQIDMNGDGTKDHSMFIISVGMYDIITVQHSPSKVQRVSTILQKYDKGKLYIYHLLGDLSADLNCDNKVNLCDFSILMSYWGTNGSGATSRRSPDINQDGIVDIIDYSIMMSQWTE
jgi:hypothetical protein